LFKNIFLFVQITDALDYCIPTFFTVEYVFTVKRTELIKASNAFFISVTTKEENVNKHSSSCPVKYSTDLNISE
jgi:hypothetical protein